MNRTPLIVAIVLLLLPVLYVGSYFALVTPFRGPVIRRTLSCGFSPGSSIRGNYRTGDLSMVYWPLERLDYRLRPQTWIDPNQAELERRIQREIREYEEALARVRGEAPAP